MTSVAVTTETLELLWHNYLTLEEKWDIGAMDPDTSARHVAGDSPVRPFLIAAWLGRQAFFIVAWSLWERYSRDLCDRLPVKTAKSNGDSHADWVSKSMAANNFHFAEYGWFSSANCLRNLFAHYSGRAVVSKSQRLLKRSHIAFPKLKTYSDDYVAITNDDVADLALKIEQFIEDTAQQAESTVR